MIKFDLFEKMKNYPWFLSLLIVFISMALGCSKDTDSSSSSKTTKKETLEVFLTDSRGDYKAVYIDIEQVEILWSDGSMGGWSALTDFNPGMYELLRLSNGRDELLGKIELEESLIRQIRFTLGLRNFVVFKDNDSVAMSTIPEDQTGLIVTVNDSILENTTYNLIVDFDASKSVVQVGSPRKYKIKPLMRVLNEKTNGSIKGLVSPVDNSYLAMAIQGIDTFGTYTDANGEFLIRGLDSGSYDVYLNPGELSSFDDTLIPGNAVTNGFVLDLGNIKLN